MTRGSLLDVLQITSTLPTRVVVEMALDVLKGLQFIHSSGIIHRDLKSPNLLVDQNWRVKVRDLILVRNKLSNCCCFVDCRFWTFNCYS